MRIGVPQEIKPLEGRVGLVPEACADLLDQGHEVFVEKSAGSKSGFADRDYRQAGATLVEDAAALYQSAELVVKVKEPQPAEFGLLRPDHILFCFLHLAAEPLLIKELQRIGLTAIGFETVADDQGLPILAPMSNIAGRLAIHIGTTLLHQPRGGKGLLLGGLAGTKRGRVVVLGAGHAGGNAASVAAAMGAEVVVFDRNPAKLAAMRGLGDNVTGLFPYRHRIREEVTAADILVGAVLVPGARAPVLVERGLVSQMRAGSVIVDVSVDQGGCIETTEPRNYNDPTYRVDDIIHMAVTNMPGAVPRSASEALCASLMPFLVRLAGPAWQEFPPLRAGVNVRGGEIVHPALRATYLSS